MRVRSTVKAVILNDGKILMNKCNDEIYGDYYALPGGGQNPNEPLEDAIVREIHEETGYSIRPVRLNAVFESIRTDEFYVNLYPNLTHKLILIFRCELDGTAQHAPTEMDIHQTGLEWIPIDRLGEYHIAPDLISRRLKDVIASEETLFLGVNRK